MITEDYVNYEIAKLLKENGFKEIVQSLWIGEDEYHYISTESIKLDDYNSGGTCLYSAPTHQMALKWLREVHNLHITIKPYITEDGNMYLFEIYKLEAEKFTLIKTKTGFEKSELANEAALKYTLENLIDMTNEEKARILASGIDCEKKQRNEIRRAILKMAQWKDEQLGWHDAKKEQPPMDEEVIVLTNILNGKELGTPRMICFGHIVDKNICVDYDGWNIPGVAYWMYYKEPK